MIRKFCLYFGLLFITFSAICQEHESELIYFPAQLSFIYPIGTHGITSQKYVYNFSCNILAGRTGAVNGFEGAGIMNVNDKYFNGFQGAGIGNICAGSFFGFQGGGIFNVVGKDFTGFQGSGIININGANSEGAQMAGIVNINGKDLTGIQAAGIGNASSSIKGGQMAGIVNIAGYVDGAQIAGIANVADNVKGLQLAGIINICDSIDGVPLALFSFVRKNGYRRIEVSSSEIGPFQVTYKTGVRRFYTFFSLGYFNRVPEYNMTIGYGIGTRFYGQEEKYAIDLELRASQISKNFASENYLSVHSIVLDYSRILFNRFEIFIGPSANMLVAPNSLTAARVSPSWAMALKGENRIWGWVGYHAGFRF